MVAPEGVDELSVRYSAVCNNGAEIVGSKADQW